jgi:hypothetical protein
LLLGGLKRGIEIKEFNTFIGMVCQAFKALLDKLETEDKSDDVRTVSWDYLSEKRIWPQRGSITIAILYA